MTPFLLKVLCEPITQAALQLTNPTYDARGHIMAGTLTTAAGKTYPIINGVPRFVDFVPAKTVESFGDEWNFFNFTDFKVNWLEHTVVNTFGSPEAFKNKILVDAGGGSGSQSRWFAEYGAKHVIVLELSHAVDGVIAKNVGSFDNVDVIQCSIDAPPLRAQSIEGIVYCHNVIQHTPSVEKTAIALYETVAPGGEFVFNCYALNTDGIVRWLRFYAVYKPLRAVLSKMPFQVIMAYASVVSALRLIPVLGELLEKAGIVVQGDVPTKVGESFLSRLKRRFKNARLNTFDCYGSHQYQHHKSEAEIRALVTSLQPDPQKVLNADRYFMRPPPIGCALRVYR
jgi:SAM-dependent methyltransferase/uncharacterized protein YbaR (Trm112 family)